MTTATEIQKRTTTKLNQSQFFGNALLQPANRLEQLRGELAAQRERAKIEDEGYYRTVATENVGRLQEWIESTEREITHWEQVEAEHEASVKRGQEGRERAADEKLKAQLFTAFKAGNPGASEADFEAAYPELKQRHQVARMDAALARARANPAYSI